MNKRDTHAFLATLAAVSADQDTVRDVLAQSEAGAPVFEEASISRPAARGVSATRLAMLAAGALAIAGCPEETVPNDDDSAVDDDDSSVDDDDSAGDDDDSAAGITECVPDEDGDGVGNQDADPIIMLPGVECEDWDLIEAGGLHDCDDQNPVASPLHKEDCDDLDADNDCDGDLPETDSDCEAGDDDDAVGDDDDTVGDDDDVVGDDDDTVGDDDDSAVEGDDDDSAVEGDDDDSAVEGDDDDSASTGVDSDGDGIDDSVDQCPGVTNSEVDGNGNGVPDCAELDFASSTEDGGPLSSTNPNAPSALTNAGLGGPAGITDNSLQTGVDLHITGSSAEVTQGHFMASPYGINGAGNPDYFNSFSVAYEPTSAFGPAMVLHVEGDTATFSVDPLSLGSVEVCVATGVNTPVMNSADAAYVGFDHQYEQLLALTGVGGAQFGTIFTGCQIATAGFSAEFENGIDFDSSTDSLTVEALP